MTCFRHPTLGYTVHTKYEQMSANSNIKRNKNHIISPSLSRKVRLGISVLQHCTKIAGQLFCATLAIGSVRLHPLQPPETRHPPIIICIGFLFTHTHVRTGSMLLCCSLIELAG